MSEQVTVYLDGNGKWRWRHRRGSRTVGASTQGYVTKHDCLGNLQTALSANYEVLYQTKKTRNKRMYQQGVLTVPGTNRRVHVEVIPWAEEKT